MSRLSEQLDDVDPDWKDHFNDEDVAALFYADELAALKPPKGRWVGLGNPFEPPEFIEEPYEPE